MVLPGPLAPQSEESAQWGPACMAAGRGAAWEDQDLDMWRWWRGLGWWWWYGGGGGRLLLILIILRDHVFSMIMYFPCSISSCGLSNLDEPSPRERARNRHCSSLFAGHSWRLRLNGIIPNQLEELCPDSLSGHGWILDQLKQYVFCA